MSKQEVLTLRYGEMVDMLACYFIDEGRAKPKKKKRKLTMEEIFRLE